jgi:hypothetical protein
MHMYVIMHNHAVSMPKDLIDISPTQLTLLDARVLLLHPCQPSLANTLAHGIAPLAARGAASPPPSPLVGRLTHTVAFPGSGVGGVARNNDLFI